MHSCARCTRGQHAVCRAACCTTSHLRNGGVADRPECYTKPVVRSACHTRVVAHLPASELSRWPRCPSDSICFPHRNSESQKDGESQREKERHQETARVRETDEAPDPTPTPQRGPLHEQNRLHDKTIGRALSRCPRMLPSSAACSTVADVGMQPGCTPLVVRPCKSDE